MNPPLTARSRLAPQGGQLRQGGREARGRWREACQRRGLPRSPLGLCQLPVTRSRTDAVPGEVLRLPPESQSPLAFGIVPAGEMAEGLGTIVRPYRTELSASCVHVGNESFQVSFQDLSGVCPINSRSSSR